MESRFLFHNYSSLLSEKEAESVDFLLIVFKEGYVIF